LFNIDDVGNLEEMTQDIQDNKSVNVEVPRQDEDMQEEKTTGSQTIVRNIILSLFGISLEKGP
jgi:hypothetical protein